MITARGQTGEESICKPHKCDDLKWVDIYQLPEIPSLTSAKALIATKIELSLWSLGGTSLSESYQSLQSQATNRHSHEPSSREELQV